MSYNIIIYLFIGIVFFRQVDCLRKRCVGCRSRGELGTCGDPFLFNVTEPKAEPGIKVVECPSGWCGKITEGSSGAFKLDDYGAATQRLCLQHPPSDHEERCAYTLWSHRKVYMCFCNGDLCNASFMILSKPSLLLVSVIIPIFNFIQYL